MRKKRKVGRIAKTYDYNIKFIAHLICENLHILDIFKVGNLPSLSARQYQLDNAT